MNHRHCMQTISVQYLQARSEVKKLTSILVVDVELEKIVRQLAIMDGMLRGEPFTAQDDLAAEHPFRDFVPTALQLHASAKGEMNADVRAVNLLLHNQRRFGD